MWYLVFFTACYGIVNAQSDGAAIPKVTAAPDADKAAAPTITLGPLSNYQLPPAITASPSGRDLVITPDGIGDEVPPAGIDVFFGPDLQRSLEETIKGICADGSDEECATAIHHILDQDKALTVEKRFLLVTAFAISVLIDALILGYLMTHDYEKGTVERIHFEHTDVSQIVTQSATSVAVATASDASGLITITATPTPDPTSASVTTLTAAQDGYQSGDIVISLPSATAAIMQQAFAKTEETEECIEIRLRQQSGGGITNYRVLHAAGVKVIMVSAADYQRGYGLLADTIARFPPLVDAAQQAAVDNLVEVARSMPQYAEYSVDQLYNMALGILWACQQLCTGDVYNLAEYALLSSMFAEDNPGGEDNPEDDDDDTDECPADAPEGKDAPVCKDPDCSGNDDRICQVGEWKGCECLLTVTPILHPGSLEEWRAVQLGRQFLLSTTNFEWSCNEKQMTLEATAFQTLVDAFCSDVSLEADAEKKLTAKDVGLTGSLTGLQDFSCGVATYSFYEKEPEGPPAPFEEGTCYIKAHLYEDFNPSSNTSPFHMSIKSLTDSRGKDLEPTWTTSGRCEAAYPCWTDSLLENRFFMRPIFGGSVYVHFDIGNNGNEGHVSWRSDDKMEDGKFPHCSFEFTGDALGDGPFIAAVGANFDMSCAFPCEWRGGPSSKDEPES
ncbi:hypothetical protein PRZ48_012227 [Zasmidium cellare]|uniref:Uncharacterized protein n=1 Tax=Zasmidium cellare TaxID=395010 RepID=A0ABR0E490_ZASCE|nr:hypothetical protein PRZ48_012227 [Zasmidium cellare]